MITVLATLAFDYIFEAVLVGVTIFALIGHEREFVKSKKMVVVFMLVFALLGLHWTPAIEALKLSIKIGNNDVARLLGVKDEYTDVAKHLSPGWFDLFQWLAQSAIAYFSGSFVYERITRRGITGR